MSTISQGSLTAIFIHQFSCFRIAEAHLDVTFRKNDIFDDDMITLAIRSKK